MEWRKPWVTRRAPEWLWLSLVVHSHGLPVTCNRYGDQCQPCVQTHTPFDIMRHGMCGLAPMNDESYKCSVCGGTMNRVKALPNKLARFRCTCGHSEDLKDHTPSHRDNAQEPLVLEGFQQLT